MQLTEQLKLLPQQQDSENHLFVLDDYKVMELKGHNIATFLQGQLTADVENMEDDSALLTAHCNPKGRVITLFILLKQEDHFYIAVTSNMYQITHDSLNKYAQFSKITLSNIDTSHSLVGSNVDFLTANEWHGGRSIAVTENETILNALKKETDWRLNDKDDWHQLDIQAGLPRIYPDTTEKYIAQRLNLQKIPKALSTKKGCYVGQEIIARIHFLGQLKHEMVYGECALYPSIKVNDSLLSNDDKKVGDIIDVYHDDNTGKTQFLAIITSEDKNLPLKINNHSVEITSISYHE